MEAKRITPSAIERVLVETPLAGRYSELEDFRISLAGAQEKTAFLFWKGRWWWPRGATPSTHIFKLPIGVGESGIDLSSSVENEWLCSLVLRELGIPVAECTPAWFGKAQALVVKRFDRKVAKDGSWILRLPQEDLAQATGTPSGMKYESEGGPGIRQIMSLLRGSSAEEDRLDFFRSQVAFWMLCALDGHAKNFSIFLEPGGSFRLTPRYDVISAYPVLGHGPHKLPPRKVKMAMAVWGENRHYRWFEIRRQHFLRTAKDCGIGAAGEQIVNTLARSGPRAVERVRQLLPAGFPPAVSEPILKGLTAAALRLAG